MSNFEKNYRAWHTRMSYIKSLIRIGTCGIAIWFAIDPILAITLLSSGFLIAEMVGIIEEII